MKLAILALSFFFGTTIIDSYRFAAPSVTFLINQDFEGAGTPTDWSGSGDYDSTTSPLAGAQSLRIESGETAFRSSFGDVPSIWFKMMFRPASLPAGGDFFAILDSGFGDLAKVTLTSTGTLIINDTVGSLYSETASAMSAGVTYYVWVRYVKGTGSNATVQVFFNTTNSRPSFGDGKTAGGTAATSTGNADLLSFNNLAITYDVDNVQIAETDF